MVTLSSALDFVDGTLSVAMYVSGLILMAGAIFQFGDFSALVQYPRGVLFIGGLGVWLGGSIARQEKKRVRKLERKIDNLEEERDMWKEMWDGEVNER